MPPIVEALDLVKRYHDFIAVDHVSFTVEQGRVFALLGPNGAGKTSIIRILIGILFPDGGEVRLFGRAPHEVREHVGYLPEDRGLYPDARLNELLIYLGTLKGMSVAAARQCAMRWLVRLELQDWARHKVRELSQGMQQRAQIAAALLHDPPLVILDEPFKGLDPLHIHLLKELIAELRRQGRTVLLSSHQLAHVEALADEVALIHKGRIVVQGSLNALRRRFAGGKLSIRLKDSDPLPDGLPLQHAEEQNGVWYVVPRGGVTAQEILQRLLLAGVNIERFEAVYPSLEEIFLRALQGTISDQETGA